jgi:hypothetical protein
MNTKKYLLYIDYFDVKDHAIDKAIKILRRLHIFGNKITFKSKYTTDPSDEQLYNFALNISTNPKYKYDGKSKCGVLSEKATDDTSLLKHLRKWLKELTNVDTYDIESSHIRHDLNLIQTERYFRRGFAQHYCNSEI